MFDKGFISSLYNYKEDKEDKDGYRWPKNITIQGVGKINLFDNITIVKKRIYNHGWVDFNKSVHLKSYPPEPEGLIFNGEWEEWKLEKQKIDKENELLINNIKDYIKTYLSHRCKCAKKLVLVYCDYSVNNRNNVITIKGKAPVFYKI